MNTSFSFQQHCAQCFCVSLSQNTTYCGNRLEQSCEETFNHAAYFALCPEECHCVCGPIETQTWHCCDIDEAPRCPPYPPLPTTTPPQTTTPEADCDENCFPSAANVLLENGKTITMSELQTGDRVQTGMKSVTMSKL